MGMSTIECKCIEFAYKAVSCGELASLLLKQHWSYQRCIPGKGTPKVVESSKIVLTKVRVELHAPFVSTGTKINYRVYSIVFKLTSSDE